MEIVQEDLQQIIERESIVCPGSGKILSRLQKRDAQSHQALTYVFNIRVPDFRDRLRLIYLFTKVPHASVHCGM